MAAIEEKERDTRALAAATQVLSVQAHLAEARAAALSAAGVQAGSPAGTNSGIDMEQLVKLITAQVIKELQK
jgi:hypothetical protein